ncbi:MULTISPECIES: epoxide hydrolase [Rhodomicrobium]|uniref:epoxide hydrolase family protein n=1 Tax=Rhodomicrobium TaxID=1068 RepID=UPI000B4B5362|nr:MULTISPECIES: epoxide hydrolase [Rhodomicrobium]
MTAKAPREHDATIQDSPTPLIGRRALLFGLAATAGLTQRGSANDVLSSHLPPATTDIVPFKVDVPQAAIDGLRRRLEMTRWPERELVSDWSQGLPLERIQSLVEYWRKSHDWRRAEAAINTFPQYRMRIDGLGIHFLHIRSRHADALPMVLTHGWPGSVFEFLKVIGPLTDPTSHGGRPNDAFHLVIPSLPGFGFSDKPVTRGWGLPRVASAWTELMMRLGYSHWVAQGGDWGSGVTTWLAAQHARGLAAVHINLPVMFPPPLQGELADVEKPALEMLRTFALEKSGYARLQATRPQTIGYALTDSPAGQAAWIYEKLAEWSQSGYDPESVLTRDAILDNISLYWFTATAASSARLYAESFYTDFSARKLDIPVGVTIFPGENFRPPRLWGERLYSRLFYWNDAQRGGHFAAFEQPGIFVDEMRACFALVR